MPALDIFALGVFLVVWLGYEPGLNAIDRRRGALVGDMEALRRIWMRRVLTRDNRITDANILLALIHSGTFFASSNLLLVAAAAGALFGGEAVLRQIAGAAMAAPASNLVLELKIALVLATLARGLLDFIWAIRQVNYGLIILGAAPVEGEPAADDAFAAAAAAAISPAVAAFNRGVRGYYFAIAAAAWLLGPWAMIAASVTVAALLLWRQTGGPTAQAVAAVRRRLERT